MRNFGLVCPVTVHIHRSAVQRDRKSEVTNAYSHPYTQPYQFDVYSYSRIRIKCLEVKLVVNFGTTHTHTHSLTHMCVSLVRLIQSAKRERSNYTYVCSAPNTHSLARWLCHLISNFSRNVFKPCVCICERERES